MKRFATALATAALVAVPLAPTAALASGGHHGHEILRASIAGSLPTDPAIAGVNPGALPWEIMSGEARLTGSTLTVRVRGLVVPDRGNPVPTLAASVVCGGAVVATTAAVTFPASGDARIVATVQVPERCLAPAVLLNPNGNPAAYIAVTGTE